MSRRVSFLVPDIGAPSVGAAVRMAESLRGACECEIVGPDFGRGVNSMYRTDLQFHAIPCPRLYRLPNFWWESRRLERALTGDVIVAVKAFRNTVPLALRARARRGATVAVFLDEWDGGVLSALSPAERRLRRWKQWHHPLEDGHYPSVEALIPEADIVLSTTTFLQRRFGGNVIAMGVDTERFKPQPPEDVHALKESLGLSGKRIIVFGGVVRPHKGVEIIPEALARIADDSIRLLVVGPITEHLRQLMANPRYARWIQVAGAPEHDPQGINTAIHKQMPLYLDLADLIVLPLLDNPLAQSQMPMKLFEAMAMAKPIIGSAVSDLPLVLKDCGCVTPPQDIEGLGRAIRSLLEHRQDSVNLGRMARTRCVEQFARPVVGSRLRTLLLGRT
ncbi:MAG: glycosyltransferase [Kiritimatiellae bacterium]|nr:glycosyltransferase [Kiritimatiellia bacterium]